MHCFELEENIFDLWVTENEKRAEEIEKKHKLFRELRSFQLYSTTKQRIKKICQMLGFFTNKSDDFVDLCSKFKLSW